MTIESEKVALPKKKDPITRLNEWDTPSQVVLGLTVLAGVITVGLVVKEASEPEYHDHCVEVAKQSEMNGYPYQSEYDTCMSMFIEIPEAMQ